MTSTNDNGPWHQTLLPEGFVRDCCVRVSRIVFRMGVHLPYGLPRVTEGCTDVIGGESVTPDNDPFPRGSL